jgi:hypothetical protein
MTRTSIDPVTDPRSEQQVERARARLVAAPQRRERRAEALAGGLFLVAALALAMLADPPTPGLGAVAVLVIAYAAALRVEFEAGPGYTVPTVLVLVPMLYLLPAALVPFCVVAALLLGFLVNVALGRRHIARARVVLGQAWVAIGPALVFTLASPGSASWDDAPIVLAAFAAHVARDPALADEVRGALGRLLPAVAESLTPPEREGTDWDALGASSQEIREFALGGLNRRLGVIGVSLS